MGEISRDQLIQQVRAAQPKTKEREVNDPVPCKVCGATPDVVGTPVENCDVFDYFVRCSNDDCGYCPSIVDKERAIAIWNDNNTAASMFPTTAIARECAKKVHDRLTWYPNDNSVDVIAAIITRNVPPASPSDAEQLMELRKAATEALKWFRWYKSSLYPSSAETASSGVVMQALEAALNPDLPKETQ